MRRPIVNPIVPGCHPDASICRDDDGYVIVASSFALAPGLPVYRSDDLATWRLIGHAAPDPDAYGFLGLDASDGIWAPTIRWDGERYYLVFAVAEDRRGRATYLLTATDPAGPWSEPVELDADGIDPSLFFDDDGRAWFTAARDSTVAGEGPGELFLREFDPAALRLVGEETILWRGAVGGAWVEAPRLFKREGRYVLLAAEGGTERNHAVTAATSAAVTGPYRTDPRSPLLTHRHLGEAAGVANIGHADLVDDDDGDTWAVVLGVRPIGGHHTLGREAFLVAVDWDGAGPVFAPGVGRVELAAEPAAGPDDWVALRRYPSHEWDGDDVAIAPAPSGLDSTSAPAFLGVRQSAVEATLSASVEAEAGGRRGLAVLQGQRIDVTLTLELDEAGPAAVVRHRVDDVTTELARVGAAGTSRLAIEADADRYRFLVDGDIVASVPRSALSVETAGGMLGAILGLVAVGPVGARPAAFRGVDTGRASRVVSAGARSSA